VLRGGVEHLHDVVLGLLDNDVQPLAEVRGDHVHEAEPRHCSVTVFLHQLQSTESHRISLRHILMLLSYLRLGLPDGVSILFYSMYATCPADLLLDLIALRILRPM